MGLLGFETSVTNYQPTLRNVPIKSLLDSLTFEDGTDRLFRNVGNYQSTLLNIRQSEYLIYTAAEAWNHARHFLFKETFLP